MQSSYTSGAKPAEIADHYRKLFAQAGVRFSANADGAGTSIRGAATECDLLIRIRELGSAAAVTVNCAARSVGGGSNPAAEAAVIDSGQSRPGWRIRTIEEAKRESEERRPRGMADVEAARRQRTVEMSRYDKPVYPSQRTNRSFYNDDAPPLHWPSWFVRPGGRAVPQPEALVDKSGKKYLINRYQTAMPMSEVCEYYEDLFKANGFAIGTARLATGQTLSGVLQNSNGFVEASRSDDGSINGPSTKVRASFHRSELNAPITVSLTVTVTGSFGRR